MAKQGNFSRSELKELERYADQLFAVYDIDVRFTRHFFERLNDPRNGRHITMEEMKRLFRAVFKRHGKRIDRLDPGAHRIMKSMSSSINLPFVIQWDDRNAEFDLVAKTIMRKRNFKSHQKFLKVENMKKSELRDLIREELSLTRGYSSVSEANISNRGSVINASDVISTSIKDALNSRNTHLLHFVANVLHDKLKGRNVDVDGFLVFNVKEVSYRGNRILVEGTDEEDYTIRVRLMDSSVIVIKQR